MLFWACLALYYFLNICLKSNGGGFGGVGWTDRDRHGQTRTGTDRHGLAWTLVGFRGIGCYPRLGGDLDYFLVNGG